ncbi:stage III sporulation protein AF [Paenibacillus puerhi]|uniref:stage III sporulation protein AF n=1 Tax=Paenibacillus puerhi TaxID=2692622 RepID=UPI00135843B8|nr:stage III sporulation protein AF [Paenibacillus puerhi]
MSQWLKSVVLVILIATFVDLLLPNRSMQRYVKTVMSLFLLMTLLQPLLSLLRTESAIEERLTATLLQPEAVKAEGRIDSLEVIRQRGQTLQERQREDAERLVRSQVAELMKRQIEQQVPVSVRSVNVETGPNDQGQPVIRRVVLAVEEAKPEDASREQTRTQAASPAIGAFKPMEPVTPPAEVRIGRGAAPAAQTHKEEQTKLISPSLLQAKTQIIRLLELDWQLRQEQIELMLEPSPGR